MEERKYALLIDAENTSSKYVDVIISELKKYGIITYQRMYGDFTNPDLSSWNKKALKYAIVPHTAVPVLHGQERCGYHAGHRRHGHPVQGQHRRFLYRDLGQRLYPPGEPPAGGGQVRDRHGQERRLQDLYRRL